MRSIAEAVRPMFKEAAERAVDPAFSAAKMYWPHPAIASWRIHFHEEREGPRFVESHFGPKLRMRVAEGDTQILVKDFAENGPVEFASHVVSFLWGLYDIEEAVDLVTTLTRELLASSIHST